MSESTSSTEFVFPASNLEDVRAAFGTRDELAHVLRQHLAVHLIHRNGELKLLGRAEDIESARPYVERAIASARSNRAVSTEEFTAWIEDGKADVASGSPIDSTAHSLERPLGKEGGPPSIGLGLPKGIQPKSPGQLEYIRAIQKHDITFAVGPAGTGKTFLAASCAVSDLKRGRYKRLMLVRPAVEAGEKLGFLPGDFEAKVNPYLRPLFDALYSLLDPRRVQHYADREVIEVVPLAYMRGRTLDQAFIILDEAQNTTPKQMKMFLTRLGNASKMVVTGDDTQVDLHPDQVSGLEHSLDVLHGVQGIGRVRLTEKDIVRHPLVQRIVKAYDAVEPRKPVRRS